MSGKSQSSGGEEDFYIKSLFYSKDVSPLVDPPALDRNGVLIEAVVHADLQVNGGLDHPHWDTHCFSSHLNRYLLVQTFPSLFGFIKKWT